ncbi:zinc metallopeptidase, partial [Staphylococcus epidermidis]|uniref:zinc metallopeptidase n=1 Tax=Staphylococcus epidermidis TaxID=1282 RepID=UPI0037D9ADA8
MLHPNPIYHLHLLKPQRFLTHHYHPNKKLLSLSPPNYHTPSLPPTPIPPHQLPHPIQHHQAYPPLTFTTPLLPLPNIATSLTYIIIILPILLTPLPTVFPSTVLSVPPPLISLPLLFSILTLPLHFNPTSTPIKQITPLNILNHKQYKHPKKLLSPPPMTYL